jgi:hypothetical protein
MMRYLQINFYSYFFAFLSVVDRPPNPSGLSAFLSGRISPLYTQTFTPMIPNVVLETAVP